jgi:hypothetical protein
MLIKVKDEVKVHWNTSEDQLWTRMFGSVSAISHCGGVKMNGMQSSSEMPKTDLKYVPFSSLWMTKFDIH